MCDVGEFSTTACSGKRKRCNVDKVLCYIIAIFIDRAGTIDTPSE